MIIDRAAVLGLRVFLVLLFGVLVVFQTLSLPGQFRHLAEENPNDAALRWPATIVAVFWVLCIQVVVVAIWRLLTMVQDGRIFSDASFKWVDAIIGAIGAAWLVLVAVFLLIGFNADDPGPVMLFLLLLVGVTVVGLLMIVMRALLRQATTLRTDLDGVI